jgi:hypothetical protein
MEAIDAGDLARDVTRRGELRCDGGSGKIVRKICSASSVPIWSWKFRNSRRRDFRRRRLATLRGEGCPEFTMVHG